MGERKNILLLSIIFAATIFFAIGIFVIPSKKSSPSINQQIAPTSILMDQNSTNSNLINQQFSTISVPEEKSGTDSCPSTVTDIDNNTYNTVQIGIQCWMKENLKATKNPSGASIKRYCYNNDTNICNTDGGLYDWNTAMNGSKGCNGTGASQPQCATPVQGICPNGWHIPSHYEWITLEKNVGSNSDAFVYDEAYGKPRGTDEGKNLAADGSSGFNALLAGDRVIDENGAGYMLRGKVADFWSSTITVDQLTIEKEGALELSLISGSSDFKLLTTAGDKKFGISVRCLKN